MKKYQIVYLLLIILLAACSQPSIKTTDNKDTFVAQLIDNYPELKDKPYEITSIKRVVDGDTYETDSGQKVRIIGVNTPEVFGKTQHYGRESSDFSKKKLEGQTVYLFKDVSDTDRYNRLLRYVFIEKDLVMFNETLLFEGFASTMTVPPNVTFAEKFVLIERETRELNKGLWGQKSESTSECDDPEIKGNINSSNEKIYHIPSGRYYDITKPEVMFCSEPEAIAEGFRKSKQ